MLRRSRRFRLACLVETFWNNGAILTISTISSRHDFFQRRHLDGAISMARSQRFHRGTPSRRFRLARLVGTFWNDGAISMISTIPSRHDFFNGDISTARSRRFHCGTPSRRFRLARLVGTFWNDGAISMCLLYKNIFEPSFL